MSDTARGYAVFSAAGQVVSCETKESLNGYVFVEMVLVVGTYQGQPQEFSCIFWDTFSGADRAGVGDTVVVTGSVRCPLNQSGYRNPRISAKSCNVLKKAERTPKPMEPQGEVYDEEIPF